MNRFDVGGQRNSKDLVWHTFWFPDLHPVLVLKRSEEYRTRTLQPYKQLISQTNSGWLLRYVVFWAKQIIFSFIWTYRSWTANLKGPQGPIMLKIKRISGLHVKMCLFAVFCFISYQLFSVCIWNNKKMHALIQMNTLVMYNAYQRFCYLLHLWMHRGT